MLEPIQIRWQPLMEGSPVATVPVRLAAIDALRGLSWLAVLVAHAESGPGWVGRMGVGIFFAISGYLITSIVLHAPAEWPALVRFYFRRCVRIFVPYAAFLVLAVAVVHFFVPDERAGLIDLLPFAATFTTDLKNLATGITLGHTWSICVEERFYLFWPAVLILTRHKDIPAAITLTIVAGGWVVTPALVALFVPGFNAQQQAFWFLPWPLLAGAAVAVFRLDQIFCRWSPGLNGAITAGAIVVYALFTAAQDPIRHGWDGIHGMGTVFGLVPGLSSGVAVAAAMHSNQLFCTRPGQALCWVGTLSYSAYLIHVPFALNARDLCSKLGIPAAGFLVAALWCLPFAWLFHRFVEAPALRWRDRWECHQPVVMVGAVIQTLSIAAGLAYVIFGAPELLRFYFTVYPR